MRQNFIQLFRALRTARGGGVHHFARKRIPSIRSAPETDSRRSRAQLDLNRRGCFRCFRGRRAARFRAGVRPSPFPLRAAMGTTTQPSSARSFSTSMRMPSRSAMSIMFNATMTGRSSSRTSPARNRLRSRFVASTTTSAASGAAWPAQTSAQGVAREFFLRRGILPDCKAPANQPAMTSR